MDGERDGLIVRTLTAADAPRLVRIDQALTGRNRKEWYEGKLKRALLDSDIRISLGAERDGVLVGAVLGSLHYGEFGIPEPIAVLDTVLTALRECPGGGLMSDTWRESGTLRIVRAEPHITGAFKLLPLHVLGKTSGP